MTILEILKDEQKRLNWSTAYAVELLEKGYPLDFEMGDRTNDELDSLPKYNEDELVSLKSVYGENFPLYGETGIGKTPINAVNTNNTGITKLAEYSIHELEEHLETLGYSVIKTEELEHLEYIKANHPC